MQFDAIMQLLNQQNKNNNISKSVFNSSQVVVIPPEQIVTNEQPHILEYDEAMLQKYRNKVKNGMLKIQSDQDLKSLEFINTLNLYKLELEYCYYIIPKLDSQTIKQLYLINCVIQSLKNFQLENIEDLHLQNYSIKQLDLQEITRFVKLTKLCLGACIVDISPLSLMTGLTNLILNFCEISNEVDITALQYLTNLTNLSLRQCNLGNLSVLRYLIKLEVLDIGLNKDTLHHPYPSIYNAGARHVNKEVDITSLQYLTKLTKLQLESCNLVSLEALRTLINLEQLNIFGNTVVYIESLSELKQLSVLDARFNNIIDSKTILQHTNFKNFDLNDQKQPTQQQLKVANIQKLTNSPVRSLKSIQKQSSYSKAYNNTFRLKISEQLQKQFQNLSQFISRTAYLLKQMNAIEGCQ
ncbi:leucine_Rich Repeat (LRR)-containing protein [Hexamita inflata]|uniref:Partial n=1 Tax=Hexamita inflata TaxID=28002 RepID=A0ABP1GZY9_9EUKA